MLQPTSPKPPRPGSETAAALIARLQGLIHDCLRDLIGDEPLAIVDFPDIRNVGDSAIWLGEIAYLADRFGKTPAYVSRIHDYSADALRRAVPDGPVFIHGGGNFGDIWIGHQDFRERVIAELPDRLVVQFPQSIHFSSQARADEAARAIGRHKRFVLLVRDVESLEFARRTFDCEVRLCPDMAFCIGALRPAVPRVDVLAMLREDKEKSARHDLSPYPNVPVEDWIDEWRPGVRIAKALGAARAIVGGNPAARRFHMLDAAANARLRRGVRQLSRGRAIVTDRLHVHIVSTLLGVPHAVLDNNYGKIRRFMDAFSGTADLAYRAGSFDDAMRWARERAHGR